MEATGPARRQIVCFGNELHGDDGFGPAVGRRLAESGLPAGWALHPVGTRSLDALALLQDCEAAILVDAEAPCGRPGRLRERRADELRPEATLADHGQGLGFVLQALPQLRAADAPAPRLRILTAEMDGLRRFDPVLSPGVAQAVDEALPRLWQWMRDDDDGRRD